MSLRSLSDILGVAQSKNSGNKKSSKGGSVLNFLDLVYSWNDIVGPKLGAHTLPLKINGIVLTILTDHPVYSQQLSFLEKEIIHKIQKAFPELSKNLKHLYFQVNAQFFNKKYNQLQKGPRAKLKKENNPQLHPFNPDYKNLKKEFEELNLEAEDDEIRELLFSLFVQGKNQ